MSRDNGDLLARLEEAEDELDEVLRKNKQLITQVNIKFCFEDVVYSYLQLFLNYMLIVENNNLWHFSPTKFKIRHKFTMSSLRYFQG